MDTPGVNHALLLLCGPSSLQLSVQERPVDAARLQQASCFLLQGLRGLLDQAEGCLTEGPGPGGAEAALRRQQVSILCVPSFPKAAETTGIFCPPRGSGGSSALRWGSCGLCSTVSPKRW